MELIFVTANGVELYQRQDGTLVSSDMKAVLMALEEDMLNPYDALAQIMASALYTQIASQQ